MSELKITGNPNPVVGKEELYSVNQLLPSPLPFQNLSTTATNPFELPVEWSVHTLEKGRWIKKEENNKTGNKVSYKFIQKSLERKGIRILAKRGEQTARLDIKPHNAESPKIDSIEFLDKQGNKPSKPFAYGQTLKARVHCLHMENRRVFATLWEDDAPGAGHDKANEKNKMKTLSGIVKDGITDIDFVLEPDFAKIADAIKSKGDTSEGKTHEYYVTAEILNTKTASKNTNVANPNYKDTTAKPKKQTPAQKKGPSKKQEKEKSILDDVIDWWEDKIKIDPIVLPNPIDAINSVLKIFQPDEKKENGVCVCKDYDLIWGNKVSCDFRKKVVEICKELWPNDYKNMANNLMAVMAWETGETFSPSKKNPKSSATGLIQFMADTAEKLGTTTTKLAKMTGVEQLEYVKKYFLPLKGKKLEFVDFYLQVLFPASMGKPDNHVVFSIDGRGLNENDRNYALRIKAYGVNGGFDTNPKYGNNDGMVTKDEIKKGIQIYIDKGKLNKNLIDNKCSAGNKEEEKKDSIEEVRLHFEGQTSNEGSLSKKTKAILKEVGKLSKNFDIYITSTARNTYDQARIMYENCSKPGGVAKQKEIYANPGDKVIDVYVNEKKLGKSKMDTIIAMENKIKDLGPSNVSKHIADFTIMNTLDISYTKLSNKNDFLSEIKKREELDKVLIENECYHIQINQ